MNRRDFVQTLYPLVFSGLVPLNKFPGIFSVLPVPEKPKLILPDKKQINWQAAELGMIFHYDISIFGNQYKRNNTYRGGYNPVIWSPPDLDTDQWVRIAKESGCRYAFLTATHFQGFLNWSTDLYPYGMKQTSWKKGKGDLVELFINSCHKFGIQPGLYMSTHRNYYQKVDNWRVNWGKGGKGQSAYNNLCEKIVEELCTRYGKLFEFWFDAGNLSPEEGGSNILPVIDKNQPDVIYYCSNQRRDHRWCGKSDQGLVGDPCWATTDDPDYSLIHDSSKLEEMLFYGMEDGTYWSPAYSELPLCNQWFWRPGEEFEASQKSLVRLLGSYFRTVGRNANLVLGATPDRSGLIPKWQEKRLLEFGDKVRNFNSSEIQHLSGRNREFIFIPKRNQKINYIIVQEDLSEGERVREWRLDGFKGGGYKLLSIGKSIGNKRILFFDSDNYKRLRFTVEKSQGQSNIKLISIGLIEDDIIKAAYT